MNSEQVQVSYAFPIVPLLTVLFVGLKLTGHIAWSWWWVLSPMWIPLALVAAFLAVVIVFQLIVAAFD